MSDNNKYNTTYNSQAAKIQALSKLPKGGSRWRSGFTSQSLLRQQNCASGCI